MYSYHDEYVFSLKEAEKPFCERLHRVRDLMDRSNVSIEEVIFELGQYVSLSFQQGFHLSSLLSSSTVCSHILIIISVNCCI